MLIEILAFLYRALVWVLLPARLRQRPIDNPGDAVGESENEPNLECVELERDDRENCRAARMTAGLADRVKDIKFNKKVFFFIYYIVSTVETNFY